MRDGIDWSEVGSGGRFEKIVSVLISTINPDSQRVDGSGGDGGRDHQLISPDRVDFWQSKYFLRRLSESGTRKGQVIESLVIAAALQPDSWTMVTPMVPNPTELTWFDRLRADYPFELVWRGGDWLDAQLAKHPSIVQYFMSSSDRYVSLLRQLQDERDAMIDGLPAAAERIEFIASQLNESNPFYALDFTVVDGRISTLSLRPKYHAAEHDSPIEVNFTVVTGQTPPDQRLREQVEAALDWGEVVEIPAANIQHFTVTNAPPGFEAVESNPSIRFGAAGHETISQSLRLTIRSPDGSPLASIPAVFTSRVVGLRGATLAGQDHTNIVKVRLRLDQKTLQLNFNLSFGNQPEALPATLLPVLKFIQYATGPNLLGIRIGDSDEMPGMELPSSSPPETYVQFVEELAYVQNATNFTFPLPVRWKVQDELNTRRAYELLRGHRVKIGAGVVTFSMRGDKTKAMAALAGDSEYQSLAATGHENFVATICGNDIDLGPYTIYIQKATVRLDHKSGDSYSVIAEPANGFGVEAALGNTTFPPGLPAVEH